MSRMSELLRVTEEEKDRVLKENNVTWKDLNDSVEVLKTWFSQLDNIHEDAVVTDNQLIMALFNGKMSIEKAKRSIEGYLTCKTLYFDYFQHLYPGEKFKKLVTVAKSVVMPRLLPNLSRLHVGKVVDPSAEAESGMDYYYMGMLLCEMRMLNDFSLATALLVDMQDFSFKHFIKFTPSVNFKLVHLLTSLSLRIDKIHIINAPSFYDKVNLLMKAILPSKILEKIHIYNSLEELHKAVPKEFLPKDYGGSERSLDEFQELWIKEFEANGDLLKELLKIRAKEVLKVPSLSMDIGMGMDGSFKKLEID